MRDDLLRARLVEANPWWRAVASGADPTGWAVDDQMLRSRARFDLGYRCDVLDDIAVEPVDDRLIVLRGPRRVGKSVALKDLAVRLCARPDIDPRQLIYLSTEELKAPDLRRVTALGRELTRSVDRAPRIWLLDELTGLSGWTQAIKYLRDQTQFGADTVVCTGSSWDSHAPIERDLLAGRAGHDSQRRVRLLMPMSFRDVVRATGRDVPVPLPVPPWDLQGTAVSAAADASMFVTDELDLAWQSFLTSGGFPRAVAEHHRTGGVSDSFIGDLVAWLHRDVEPDDASDSVAQLLTELAHRASSPLNRTDTAAALNYSSRQVFDVRLNRLVASFAALWCHQINGGGRRIPGTQSKLYLADPLLAWIGARVRAGLPSPDFARLTEAALGVALARAVEAAEPGRWTSDDTIAYSRTDSGKEVDFAPVPTPTMSGPETTTPLESKWVAHGWRGEARVIEAKYGRGVLATRTIIDRNHAVWALPAPLVALLLG